MKQIGINYLHNHPHLEKTLNIDEDHVIVDRNEWKQVIDYILSDKESLQVINDLEVKKFTKQDLINFAKHCMMDLLSETPENGICPEISSLNLYRINYIINKFINNKSKAVKNIEEMTLEELEDEFNNLSSYLYLTDESLPPNIFVWNGLDYYDAQRRCEELAQKIIRINLKNSLKI